MNVLPGGSAAASTDIKVGDRITASARATRARSPMSWLALDPTVSTDPRAPGYRGRLQILAPRDARLAGKLLSLNARRHARIAGSEEKSTPAPRCRDVRIGVILVPSFYQDFQARMKGDADFAARRATSAALIDELRTENIESLVVDLRDNGGGHLSEATSLVGLFVERGPPLAAPRNERPHRGTRRS